MSSKANEWKFKNKRKHKYPGKKEPVEKPVANTTTMWMYGKGTTSKKIKIGHWNVNGIRSIHKRKFLLPYLVQNEIDILCVNETKIDEEAYKR